MDAVGVLVLVDLDVEIAGEVLRRFVGVFKADTQSEPQNVLEIHRVHRLQGALIFLVYGAEEHVGRGIAPGQQVAGGDSTALGPLQFVMGALGVVIDLVLHLLQYFPHDGQLITVVVDDECGRIPGVMNENAQEANPEGMKGADARAAFPLAGAPIAAQFYGKHLTHAFRHLPGRLVGKGQRQYAFGRHGFAKDQMGDAGRDHAGLAAPRAGQNQDGSVRGRNGFTLLGIERIEIGGHPDRFLAGAYTG